MAEQHPILHLVPTSLSTFRAGYGVKQAVGLLTTPPEERTWGDAFKSFVVATTDKADGKLSDRWGSTKNGALIDRIADNSFSVLGEVALGFNEGILPIHPIVGVAREISVQAMRQSAAKAGRPEIAVGERGRQKTAIKMLKMNVARSPLSTRPGLMESLASVGTAFSLISGAEYAQQYFAGKKQAKPEQPPTVRNGRFRQATASPFKRLAGEIHKRAEWIQPDHLTRLGELTVEASALAVLAKPELGPLIAAGPYTAGSLVDVLDGNLAREKGISSLQGMLNDVKADKRQEIVTAAVNSLIASRRGNRVAARQYASAAATASLPAYFRASAEAKGHIVSEDASGSRVIRGIEGGVGLGLNASQNVSNVNSALQATGSVVTAWERATVVLRGEASPHYHGANNDPESRAYAAARRDVLGRYAAGGALVGAGLIVADYVQSRRQKPVKP